MALTRRRRLNSQPGPTRRRPAAVPLVLAGAFTALLLVQTVVSPTVGLSDNGDYGRSLAPLGLVRPAQSFTTRWVFQHYAYGPHRSGGYASSQLVLAWPVVRGARLLGARTFDLRWLAAVYAVALGAGVWLLLRALPGRRVQAAVGVALLVALGDSAVVAYLGSFYTEPASMVGLVLVLAAVLTLRGRRRVPVALLVALTLAALLLVLAKTQDLALVLPLAGLLVLLRPRAAALGCAGVLVVACLLSARAQPTLLRDRNLYDSVFAGILPASSDPAADLRSLGLDPALTRYRATSAYGRHSGFEDPRVQPLFRDGTRRVARFYATHPSRVLTLSRVGAGAVATLRVPYLGNRTRADGGPFLVATKACEPCLYSTASRALRPAAPFLLPALYLGALAAAWALRRRAVAGRGLADALVVLAGIGVVGFASGFGDGEIELVKHMLLVEVATALLAVLTLASLLVPSDARTAEPAYVPVASGTSSASTMV